MAYRYGDRRQAVLFPPSVEDYVPQDAPVRVYDAFVEALDFARLGIVVEPHKVGCPQYDPKIMLKLLIYGYSYGIRSSRKLERAAHYNVAFMWLVNGLKPDHKTIAEFRRKNKTALTKVLKQCVRLCVKLNLIEGNTLFVDGSRVRANASSSNSWDEKRCLKRLKQIDARIAKILKECEAADQSEQNNGSMVKVARELADNEVLKARVSDILAELKADENKHSVNTTDNDCVRIHGRQGSHAGYTLQNVVDDKNGLIVSSEVVDENHDTRQFARQIDNATEVLDKPCQRACADSGYSDLNELEKIDNKGIKVIVPNMRLASGKKPGPFDVSRFIYDSNRDCFICPAGETLHYSTTESKRNRKSYIAKPPVCKRCKYFGQCTKSQHGRKVTRLLKQDLYDRLARQYKQKDNQEIYKRRKQKVEHPFGHMKHNLGVSGFLLRGLGGVNAEASLLSSCFNIARMITLVGIPCLLAALTS